MGMQGFTIHRPTLNVGSGAYTVKAGPKGRHTFGATLAGSETFNRPHNSTSSFGMLRSVSAQGRTHGPLLQHFSTTQTTSGKTRSGHMHGTTSLKTHHDRFNVNVVKAGAVVGGAAVAYGGAKLYQRHRRNVRLNKQLAMYHQTHSGPNQSQAFHQTHMGLGSAGF